MRPRVPVGGGASMVSMKDAGVTFESDAHHKVKEEPGTTSTVEGEAEAEAEGEEETEPNEPKRRTRRLDEDPLAPRSLPPARSCETEEVTNVTQEDDAALAALVQHALRTRQEEPTPNEAEKLYLFQFPTPFPGFVPVQRNVRRVAFSQDTAGGAGTPGARGPRDGRIGTIKVYPDGSTRFVLGRARATGYGSVGSQTKSKSKPKAKGKEEDRPRDNRLKMQLHSGTRATFLEQPVLLDRMGGVLRR